MDLSPGISPRELGRDLRFASDDQLGRVVAIVDALAARGPADALLDPVRPRLARLRPSRPPTLSRILFAPLDPVIVPAGRWRPGTAALPRSALAVLGPLILGGLGRLRSELEREAGGSRGTPASMPEIGVRLWPAAAEVARALPPPPDWTRETGLPPTLWPGIRDGVAAMLGRAVAIEAALHAADAGPALKLLLRGARESGPAATALIVRALIARHRRPDEVLLAIAALREPAARAAAELAIQGAVAGIPDALERIGEGGSQEAASQANRLAAMLDAMDESAPRSRLQEWRADALRTCHARLETCLRDELLRAVPSGPTRDDAGLNAAEGVARDARRLHGAARRLGGDARLDRTLQDSADAILALPAPALDKVDRMRLLEILLGPEAALAHAGPDAAPG